jgi:zinc protease
MIRRIGLSPNVRSRCWSIIIFTLATSTLLLNPAGAAERNVMRAILANGLRVVIVRNTLAPVVTTSVNYLVGSTEAPVGFPGTAHAQEHMMFRGSPGISADQLTDIGNIMGGDFNANTSEGRTQYVFTVPSMDLDIVLHIEALRMAGVNDSKKEWDQERGAIEQEVAEDSSDPQRVVDGRLRAAMFSGTPYEQIALGTKASFDKTTSGLLKRFYASWYAPNNAILVVVGNIDPQTTLERIRVLFGPIQSKILPARIPVVLKPVNTNPINVKTDSPVATRLIAIRMPGSDSPDFPALELLGDVLSSRRFALYALVPQGKAVGTDFSLEPLPQASIASVAISIRPEGNLGAAGQKIRSILNSVAHNGVPAELVTAAKDQEYREMEIRKNSIEDLAEDWSDAVALYGAQSPDEEWARLKRVTPEEVNRVARKYIDLDHSISVTMSPVSDVRTATREYISHQSNVVDQVETKLTPLPDWAVSALNNLAVPKSALHPVVTRLPNGITLIVQPEDASDTVSLYGHIENRPETETASGKEGVANILNTLFKYGSEHLDRLTFQTALDSIGAREHAGPDFGLQTLTRDFDRGVALLADNELHPVLSASTIRIAREQYSHIVAANMQSPAFLASRSLRESLFTRDDPSLRQPVPTNVDRLTTDDVKAYYQTAFRPDLTSIVVIGKITPDIARAVIERYFGAWRAIGPKPVTVLPAAPVNHSATLVVRDDSKVQDTVELAENIPLARKDSDYYALSLGNAVLAGGFYSSRLSVDLRKKTGLVYSVNADVESGKTRSIYTISYACDPKNVVRAANIVSHELTDLQTTAISDDELTRAKAYLLRQLPLREANIEDIARSFNELRDLDLPLNEPEVAANRYASLSAGEVRNAFRKWMRPKDLVRISQGPIPQ